MDFELRAGGQNVSPWEHR